jgi:hypothetical protein
MKPNVLSSPTRSTSSSASVTKEKAAFPTARTPDDVEVVTVYAGNPHRAAVVRSAIESSGIPASLVREGTGSYPVTVGAIGEGRVLVRESDVAAALEIINSVEGDQERMPRPIKAARRPWWYWAALFIAVVFAVTILVDALRYGY